jgi:hypothetical protein
MDYFLDSGVLLVSQGLIAGTVCAALARHRGYSATVFGGLGCVAGLGAVPLTWLATARPVLGQQSEGLGFNPIHARSEVALPETSDNQQAREDLQVWGDLYAAVQQGLVVTMVLFLAGLAALMLFLFTSILPTFVTLFEGMSLKLPPSTEFLIFSTKLVRNPSGRIVLWLLSLVLPSLLYLAGIRTGYAFPVLGKVWRCSDRLWQLYALQSFGQKWQPCVPVNVVSRLASQPFQDLPAAGEDYAPYIRRQRDRMMASIWMCFPLAVGILAIGAVGVAGFVASVFQPLYGGCCGNL